MNKWSLTLHCFNFPLSTISPSVLILSNLSLAFSVRAVEFVMLFPKINK